VPTLFLPTLPLFYTLSRGYRPLLLCVYTSLFVLYRRSLVLSFLNSTHDNRNTARFIYQLIHVSIPNVPTLLSDSPLPPDHRFLLLHTKQLAIYQATPTPCSVTSRLSATEHVRPSHNICLIIFHLDRLYLLSVIKHYRTSVQSDWFVLDITPGQRLSEYRAERIRLLNLSPRSRLLQARSLGPRHTYFHF
jgi:hypothetical protein